MLKRFWYHKSKDWTYERCTDLWNEVSVTDEFKNIFQTSNRGKRLSWKSVYNVLSGNKVFEGQQISLLHKNYNNDTSDLAWLANVADKAAPIITMNPTLPSLKSAASSAQRQTVSKPASTSSKSQ